MADSSADRDPVERLAEEFLARHRRGENPPLSEYVDRHPEWAGEIRDLFPALVMMERLKPANGDVTGSFLGGHRAPEAGRVPERLGDFRILREVGRGGMGIVFEAEQESLGRHVALKVLPSHALLNPRHLQRFLREAKSAARLHHTNIVPVFGVGDEGGLHYYVMQFIAGSGLHELIAELRRLKAADRPIPGAGASPGPTRSLNEVARGLSTGTTTEAIAGPDERNGDPPADPSGPPAPSSEAGRSILSASGRDFAREVARVGLQVAEALGYAHGQGVLHRDIKPANLLIDVHGTVWVADFGLAKATADGDDLTNEGDVLGTLRYMAPERFRGEADARSDLYALGLTLYELLTLRPAFDQEDRDRLIHQVTTGVPPRPRALNPEVPRDLETIVLKAIEHEPDRRYQDASAFADDLERFLGDRPILARRVGTLERARKWARRKPAIAGLLAALVAAIVVGFAGITWQWRQAVAASRAASRNADSARTNFLHALDTVNTFCTQVSEEQLLDQPGMQPLRRRLLDSARTYYQTFQRQQGDDPRLMGELALTFRRSGVISSELGDAVAAHDSLLRAKDILKALCRLHPEDIELRVQLARCLIEIDDADRLGQFMSIIKLGPFFGSSAVPLTEGLVAADPENLEYLRLLGRCYEVEGIREFRRSRYAEARGLLGKSIATLECVLRKSPGNVEAARWLALAQTDLGDVCREEGHPAEAVRAFGRASSLLATLEEDAPTVSRHRLARAACLVSLGLAHIDLGQYREATTRLREADDRLARIVRDNPEAASSRYWLALAKQGLGRLAMARGRADAVETLREAIALHERVAPAAMGHHDWLALAWSYLRLERAELEAGRPEAVPPLHARIDKALATFKGQLIIGDTMPQQARELSRIEDEDAALLASARAATVADRIAAGRRDVQARRLRADKSPANPVLRGEVAREQVRLAETLAKAGELAEALAILERARPALESLVEADAEDFRCRMDLARAWEALGRVRSRSGREVEARDASGRAVAIAEGLARVDPAYTYDLACMLGLRGTLASSEADTTKAVAILHRAIQDGLDNEYLLRTDPRLEALRQRFDFPAPSRVPR